VKRVLGLLAVLLLTISTTSSTASASSAEFRYKFPCYYSDACWVTQLAHVPGNALDFDPQGSQGLSPIPAMAQGTVANLDDGIHDCPEAGIGKWVLVADIHGRSTYYGHLSSIGVANGTQLLQGDQLGGEGNTGNSYQCQPHLHWQPGTLPAYINGVAVSGLSLTNYGGPSGANTNSVIGEYSTAGLALRTYYTNHGGWNSIGWTHKHCPGTCTLNMTNNLAWGRMQDFRHDPDGYGGTFNTIHVSSWDQTHAHLVDSVFWQAWAVGGRDMNGDVHPIGMAKADRGSCPPGSASCLWYQPFDVGFVYMNGVTGVGGVFCPDVNGDREVTIVDISIEADRPLMPPNPPTTIDVDGDNMITILDLTLMAGDFLHDCRV
jgi:hypothetical protein